MNEDLMLEITGTSHNLPSLELVEARALLTVTRNSLRDANTKFALYVDPEGNASSGSKGLIVSIHSRIKKYIDPDQPELSIAQCETLIVLYKQWIRIMEDTIRLHKLRGEAKGQISKTIKIYGEAIRDVA